MTSNPIPAGALSSAQDAGSVCIGSGSDASVDGLLATIVLCTVVGLLIWILFALLRPRFRQVYGLREWFVSEDVRPKPLKNSFWAFLTPPIPLVPSITKDASDAGVSAATDATIFPSDEQLVQRTLYHCFRVVLAWSILALGAALPLYLVSTPCLAQSAASPRFGGTYSVLQDLSLLRLLKLLQDDTVATSTATVGIAVRTIVNGTDYFWRARVRVIILVVLMIVLGVLPALYKLLREYSRLVNFYRRWADIHLQGVELGWLSAKEAPGFVGWGERQVKEFIHKTGLGSSLLHNPTPEGEGHRHEDDSLLRHGGGMDSFPEIDIQRVFSIGDTEGLSLLIEERDVILEQLEIAETKYINSFRISTPEPSLADLVPQAAAETDNHPHISRPKALQGKRKTAKRKRNPAYGSSSFSSTPTSYLAPPQYYKVGVRGVDGGIGRHTSRREPSFSESVSQRVVGSRFQEMGRSRSLLGFPFVNGSRGSRSRADSEHVQPALDEHEVTEPIPDPARFGPNYVEGAVSPEGTLSPTSYAARQGGTYTDTDITDVPDPEWVDLSREAPIDFSRPSPPLEQQGEAEFDIPDVPEGGGIRNSALRFIRRPKIFGPTPSEARESIPLRPSAPGAEAPPPHLRVQRAPPFVRPLTGFDHDALGDIYSDIRTWRTRLKAINQEIAGAQANAYVDIADGSRIRGWLLVGRGLRFLPGIELIEGRSKEDIRWDLLQTTEQDRKLRWMLYWIAMAMCGILLAIGIAAAVGLALAPAPNYTHYITFLGNVADNHNFTSGLATVLAPSTAATLFIMLAVGAVQVASRSVASVSVSAGELVVMQTMFYLIVAVAVIWLIVVGATLYAFSALSTSVGGAQTVADGSVYISVLVLAIILNVAFIAPGLLMLQPFRLRRVLNAQKAAITPRQRFRALYPRTYNPIFALSCSVLAFVFASTFSIIFPLIGPAICILLLLTLIAHRFLVGYVYGRTRSQTGGALQIWLTKRFATVLALQPILMGLELLSRELWPEGGTLVGAGVLIVLLVESFAFFKERRPGPKSLHPVTREALATFVHTARRTKRSSLDDDDALSAESSHRPTHRTRGSFASVLDMMSDTLAVHPSSYQMHGPVPLQTETLDDLVATGRAARTHPDAPPRLPLLSFADHAEEVGSILYAPELVAPDPIIWLPRDAAGVAQSEAYDLEHYHGLRTVLDVRTPAQAGAGTRRGSGQR